MVFGTTSLTRKLRRKLVGDAKSPLDKKVFHHLSLIAFFAWVGLGADGLSSSCYGPEEAYLALGSHIYLSVFVALATALTVFIISASYSQIIELFPSGGGGYLVASKLLSPSVGMISGCALFIDYVLTIAISISSGSDALFSFLPAAALPHKVEFAIAGVLLLTILNLRGVKESVMPLVPVFLLFIVTHVIMIAYAVWTHFHTFASVAVQAKTELVATSAQLGVFGVMALLMRAYSMGAGTFTGIEAVSNGLPILREPRAVTGKRTMLYMSISLALTVFGLMFAYLFFNVQHTPGKTLNASLFENMAAHWGAIGHPFVMVTLISEALLLFIAAQAGFLDGPRVLASMAVDRWLPTKFASLSDRLVTQNGILLMGGAALVTLFLTQGSVRFLVVLYSINVFITFCLSQLGMVRHWWKERGRSWKRKMFINGLGLLLCSFILVSVIIMKFHDGGWITIVVTGSLVWVSFIVKKHYVATSKQLRRLNDLMEVANIVNTLDKIPVFDPKAKTAIIMVNGYNGLGLHTLFNVIRLFGKEFRNFAFVQIGVIDAGNFKGAAEVDHLKQSIDKDLSRYVRFMHGQHIYAEGFSFIGTDVMEEIDTRVPDILNKYPNAVFFGGQLVFPKDHLFNRWLHNYTVFSMQRTFYQNGIPFVILPIRVT